MALIDQHPPCEELEAFALGRLDNTNYDAVEEHVAACLSCEKVVSQISGDTFTALLRSAQSLSDTPKPDVTEIAAGALSSRTGLWNVPDGAGTGDLPAVLANHPRYRPVRQLGSGGMGAVWLAEHRVMGRQVAVKVIRPELFAKGGAAERFQRETQAAARLHHPNIVTAFDAEQAGATPLLAMEYIDGVSLADELRRRGPLPIAEACDVVRQAAIGLQHAFECGLIHRDLKPHNLMRTADGTVKILDFGLAVLADAGERQGELTGQNVVLGTPDYIAPEQAEDSHAADIRSDIYALGCTLYHLLTGRVPFPGDSVLRKLDAHRKQEPEPMRTIRPEIPAELAAVVARLMAKSPADRYQTPAEVAAALAPFAAGTTPVRKRRQTWVAVAAALVAGILVAAGVVYRIQTDNGEVVITPESPDVEIVLLKGGKEVEVIDTKTRKRVRVSTGIYDLVVKNKPDGIEVKHTDKLVVSRGQEVLVTIERVAKSTPTEKGDEERIYRTDGLPVHAVAFSPDGRLIAVGGGPWRTETGRAVGTDLDVRLIDRVTGKEIRRFKGPTSTVTSVAFSPDGKRLTATATGDQSAYVWDVDSGKLVPALRGHKGVVTTAVFSPDGKQLLTMSRDGTIRLWDVDSGKEAWQIASAPGVATEWPAVGFLPGGKEAVVARGGRLVVLDLKTDKVVRIFDWPGGRVSSVSLSPDGKRLLTTGAEGTDRRARLWDVATGKQVREFDSSTGAAHVAFLPDGRRFLMAHGKELCLADADTGAVLATFRGHVDSVMSVALVPPGSYAVSGSVDQTVRLWHLPDPPRGVGR